MADMVFKKLDTVEEMLPNLGLIQQLSPKLTAEDYAALLAEMVPHNYYQVCAYKDDACIAVSGYWIAAKLYSGRYLEIDNFVVEEAHRDSGVGGLMINWLEEEAKQQGCKVVMLDAYVENFKAHRFYYRYGFTARGFHFIKRVV